MKKSKFAWLLWGRDFGGLVLSGDLPCYMWEAVYGDSACIQHKQPDFILLSGEPPYLDYYLSGRNGVIIN